MVINDLLRKQKISRYKLSKISGVPQTTISDICNSKVDIENCNVKTMYKIAKALNVSIEFILEKNEQDKLDELDYRSSFETFKSNICHEVKEKGDIQFLIDTLESNRIRELFNKKWYPEALYLLGMTDYLSNINNVPICTNFNDIRKCKLSKIVYPTGILIRAAVSNDENVKNEAVKNAIPEFMRFNIVENEVRNVV